jgi:hypothetical protein
VAVQKDGKILVAAVGNLGQVVAGMLATQGGVFRLNSNGTLDNGFDLDGRAVLGDSSGIPAGANSFDFRAIALEPDGRIVVVGGRGDAPGYLVVRFWD